MFDFWWIILICLMIVFIIVVSIVNNPELNRATTTAFSYFKQIMASLCAIIGLILGYPLLKRKLIDSYVIKQFEIIHENNRIVRKECLNLKEKYPIKYISNELNLNFLSVIVEDIKRLNELAIDANPDAYMYTYLLYKSLQRFKERTVNNIPKSYYESYYCETLSTFIYNHVEQVYRYSKSIGFVPNKSDIKVSPILNSKLKKYVIDNKYYHVEGIDHSFSLKKASALLVSFFSTNFSSLNSKNGLLFKCSYESVPSPSPIARIMFNQNVYIPLVLEGEIVLNFAKPTLRLVGYVRETSTKLESGVSTNYLICHYANISNFGFVNSLIKNEDSLKRYKDTYLGKTFLNTEDIEEFYKNGESIIVKIEEENAIKYFTQAKKILRKKMNKEIS